MVHYFVFCYRADVGGEHCPCPVLVSFSSGKSCLCLSDVRILSGVCLSGIFEKTLSVFCLCGRTRTRQSCPDFRCPCLPTSATEFVLSRSLILEFLKRFLVEKENVVITGSLTKILKELGNVRLQLETLIGSLSSKQKMIKSSYMHEKMRSNSGNYI